MEQKFTVMLCRFPGGNVEHPSEVDWVLNTTLACYADRRVDSLHHWHLHETPVTMSRNRAVKEAIAKGIDILLMVDNDMGPDMLDPSLSFWNRALGFMIGRWHLAPTLIAAPYSGPPPHENVYIFRWRNWQSDHPDPDYKLDQFSREEAAERSGIEAVAALPTGLIAIDMRIFTGFKVGDRMLKMPPPWFYYEWRDAEQSEKASTEDVTFTRDVSLKFAAHGLDVVFVDWDAWAVHYKTKMVGRPRLLNPGNLARLFQERSGVIQQPQANGRQRQPANSPVPGPTVATLRPGPGQDEPMTPERINAIIEERMAGQEKIEG